MSMIRPGLIQAALRLSARSRDLLIGQTSDMLTFGREGRQLTSSSSFVCVLIRSERRITCVQCLQSDLPNVLGCLQLEQGVLHNHAGMSRLGLLQVLQDEQALT